MVPVPPGIPDGAKKLKNQGIWSHVSKSGIMELYFENGRVLSRGKIKNGIKTGIWNTYTMESNLVASTGKYINGWRDGVWKFYDTQGNLYLYVTYAPEPKINYMITTDYGNENGKYERYFPDGSVEETGNFYSGRFQGPVVKYFINRNVAVRGQYNKDLMTGRWTYYYPEGSLEREENYLNGKREGIFRNYYPDGTLYHETTFKNNIEIGPRTVIRKGKKFIIKNN